MYNFIVQAYATHKGLFYWLNWQGYISNVFLGPIVFVIIYAILGRFALNPEMAQAFALGITVHSMARMLLGGLTQSFYYERALGTLSFLFVSPVNRLINFLSRPVFHLPNGALCCISSLFAAWVVADMPFGLVNWPSFIVALLVTAAAIAAFGQFIGVFTIVYREWLNTIMLAQSTLFALTGAIIPISVFPTAVQEFARLLPMTNGLFAIRATFAGAPFSAVYGDILREALTGLIYFIAGFVALMLFERIVKQTGTLQLEAI